MGCDIHLFVEKKISEKWECLNEIEDNEGTLSTSYKKEIYHERNYSLFALLAGVRNSAGVKPISEPRGLPEDVSEIVKRISDQWNDDGHSHSYYTLKELLDFSADNLVKEQGYMPEERWIAFQESLKTPTPDYDLRFPFAGWANSGLGWEHHEWSVPAKEISSTFFVDVLNKLKQMGNPEEIRIVFWFDN
jgi:hypothetical protein